MIRSIRQSLFALLVLATISSPDAFALAMVKTSGDRYQPKIDDLGVPIWNPAKEDYIAYEERLVGRPDRVACGPNPLYRDDDLDVVLPHKHGADMLIFDAKGRFYMIDDTPILIDPEGVAKKGVPNRRVGNVVSDIAVDITEFSASVEDLRKHPQVNAPRLFGASGTYGLVVGREIESESPIADGWCVIHYIDRTRRPAIRKSSAQPSPRPAAKAN